MRKRDFKDRHDIHRVRIKDYRAPAVIDVMGTASINHYMGNSRYRLEFSYISKSNKIQQGKRSALASLIAQKANGRYGEQ